MKLKTKIENINDMKNISGSHNSNLKVLEEKFECSIDIHGESILCSCDDELTCDTLDKIFTLLVKMSQLSFNITSRDIVYVCNIVLNSLEGEYLKFLQNRKAIGHSFHNKPIYAKTLKQQDYIDLLDKKDLIFSIGAAGTGKTYLAVCYAVTQLKKGNIDKIILTRPAVEAGESLGFLPGDLKEKVDPYLRPLYDALYDMLGVEAVSQLIEKQVIEIAPLAYMRGRTLENAFIILDEAQNATIDQLKMFLTRLGFNSKMIVTGDISQVDLPNSKRSGLKVSANLLKGLPEVGYIVFDRFDVVRHPLVAKIIEKFEKLEN
ncbi:TPA: PhoH family protein [Candidatus Avacholeplasma faecigallinarum]|nr:PhoH family protein [Candidatus Avacholeplasma faecigallinarum]